MSCPASDKWLLLLLGELSLNESDALERHRHGCTQCQAELRTCQGLLADLEARPELATTTEIFTERVLAACAQVEGPAPARRRATVSAGVAAVLAAAAALVLWLRAPEPAEPERWTARGGSQQSSQLPSAELFFVREKRVRPLPGAVLAQGDALLVRCSNPGAQPWYLALFVLDPAGEAHWIYPAYVDAAANPESVALAPGLRAQPLDELVELEAPSPGALRVIALFTRRALKVHEIEAALAAGRGRDIAARLRAEHIQEWSATWTQ
jgi:hypothetical protein